MDRAVPGGAAVRILELQTPAEIYAVTEDESEYGGRAFTTSLSGTVWGDFRPDAPGVTATSEGDSYVVQEADFLCRPAAGAERGGLLRLKGFDWRIVSLDEGNDGTVRLRIERVHV